jgi:hypothetical protein
VRFICHGIGGSHEIAIAPRRFMRPSVPHRRAAQRRIVGVGSAGAASAGAVPVDAAPAGAASPIIKAATRSAKELRQAPSAFQIRIGMRPDYCAGLVASKEDGLVFPRSIVQCRIRTCSSFRHGRLECGGRLLSSIRRRPVQRVTVLIAKLRTA